MKRSIWVRLIAMILVISMLAAPVSAATVGGSGHSTNGLIGAIIGIIKDIIIEIIDDWFDIPGVGDPDPTEPTEPPVPTTPEEPTAPSEPVATDPTEPEVTEPEETEPEVTEPVETEPAVETVLELVEDFSTVENGHLLRGTTYTLSQIVAQQPQTAPYALRSSPVSTLADEGTTGGGNSEYIEAEKEVFTNWVDGGQYYIQSAPTVKDGGAGWVKVNMNNGVPASLTQGAQSEATAWTVTFNKDGTYALSVSVDGTPYYLSISSSGISFSTTAVALQIEHFSPTANPDRVDDDGNLMRIGSNGYYLNRTSNTAFTTYNNAAGANNCLWFYQVKDGTTNKVTVETVTENVKVVYFPVTMFNYDTDKLNVATINKELENPPADHVFQGIYFSSGSPTSYVHQPGTYTEVPTTIVTYELVIPTFNNSGYINNLSTSAEYILVNKNSNTPIVSGDNQLPEGTVIQNVGESTITCSYTQDETVTEAGGASLWKYGQYRSLFATYPYFTPASSTSQYMVFGDGNSGLTSTRTYTYVTDAGNNGVYLGQTSGGTTYYLNDYNGTYSSFFGGWTGKDNGSIFYIYEKVSETQGTEKIYDTVTYTYAGHNHFEKGGSRPDGDLVWTGMAADQLDENENIVFNHPEGGIFSYDRDALDENYFDGVKNVYEFVGMPFVLSEGVYTFDSDKNGVYFKDTDGDTYNDPAPGTKEAPNNLQFDYGVPQPLRQTGGVADRSSNGWFPYNIYTTRTENGVTKTEYGMQDPEEYNDPNVDYHFGMRADLPFSMTPNGRIKSHDDQSTPITFNFSGDDDVWIYIDGQLVVDLGGMHNRLDIEINFAENTITYKEHTLADANDTTGSYNDPANWSDVRKLFNESEGDGLGLIDMTRAEFAIAHNHEIQFFYLERGKGTSNCKIEFNLPMLDTVMVTKNISRSWSAEQARQDAIDGEGDGTSPLTAQEKAALANKPFYFTLYRKTADNPTPVAVANTSYYLLDAEGNVEAIPSTGPDGKFFLLNGQTAKFMTDFPSDGITYFVVEDKLPKGYLTPDFTFAGESAYGFDFTGVTMDANGDPVTVSGHVPDASQIPEQEIPLDADPQSFEITATGSVEAIESLHFICENYLDKDLPNPTALAEEDIIVIDYGLPVQIDPLHNDVFRGDSIEIVHYTVGDVNFTDEEGKISKEVGDALVNAEKNLTGVFGNFKFHPQDYSATFNEEGEITNVVRDTFSYTLNKQLTEVEVLTYVVRVTGSETQDATDTTDTDYCYGQAKLYIVPATIMYYEENFNDLVHFTFLNGATAPTPEKEDAYISDYQEPGVVGDRNDSTYGSDVAYLSDPHDSNGTSYFFDTTSGAVRFWYTFTGTGTSFFARTSATTGYMQVLLFAGDKVGASGEQLSTYYRDTYFYKDEDDDTKTHDDEPLYNIPVYTTEPLEYGTYTVLVTVAKKGTKSAGPMHDDGFKRSMHEFYLDGIRVMQPLNIGIEEDAVYDENDNLITPVKYDAITNKALGAYATDSETNLDIVTLRTKLITDVLDNNVVWDGTNFVVLTDTNDRVIDADEYTSIGPKEEVYLAPGQKVRFSLKYWKPEGLFLYIGMKAPFGNGALVNIGNTPYNINNATDCYRDVTQSYASRNLIEPEDGSQPYYVITYTFEVPADATEVVSLTNIKVVGNYEFTILENEEVYQ